MDGIGFVGKIANQYKAVKVSAYEIVCLQENR